MIAFPQLRLRGSPPPRCLLIEQEVQLLAVLIELFANTGYDVDVALHGDDLQRIAAECLPQLALIGDGARGTFDNGWHAARALKNVDAMLPLLMLTSDRRALSEIGCTLRGCMFAAGLRKPFLVAELLATAHTLFDAKAHTLFDAKAQRRKDIIYPRASNE